MSSKVNYTVTDDDCDKYRDIASVMAIMGYDMSYSSVRNYVNRIMKKFVCKYSEHYGKNLSEEQINYIAQSQNFQDFMFDILHIIENNEKKELNNEITLKN